MASISVIKTISESYELIKKHYQEVLIPLVILLLLSGAGGLGGGSVSDLFSEKYSKQSGQSYSGSSIANAMADSGAIFAGLGGFLIAIVALAIVAAMVISILSQALWFSVFEHFFCILAGKKPPADWKLNMKKYAVKAIFMMGFQAAVFIAMISIPLLVAAASWGSIVSSLSGGFQAIIPLILFAVLYAVLMMFVGFLLSPLFIFYAMEGLSLADSVGKSVALVSQNLWLFTRFSAAFFAISLGIGIALILTCCLSYVLSPVAGVFLQLLWGVSLMKLKLELQGGKAAQSPDGFSD